MKEYGHQCVVWQTAINPVVALELLANGTWKGAGVLGPEAFDAVPFLDLLKDGYGSPWGIQEVQRRLTPPPRDRRRADRHPHPVIDDGVRAPEDELPGILTSEPLIPQLARVIRGCRGRRPDRHGQHRVDRAHGRGDRSGRAARARGRAARC